jgi:hypothetical protein
MNLAVSSILFKGSTAGHDDSCLLTRKLKEFEAAGFVVKDGEKSIHEENSIRFMREVIGMSKWHEEVLTNGLSLDLKDIPRRYREKNNVSALKNMEVLKEKVKEWEDDGFLERLDSPAWCCNPMSVAAKYDPVKDEQSCVHV